MRVADVDDARPLFFAREGARRVVGEVHGHACRPVRRAEPLEVLDVEARRAAVEPRPPRLHDAPGGLGAGEEALVARRRRDDGVAGLEQRGEGQQDGLLGRELLKIRRREAVVVLREELEHARVAAGLRVAEAQRLPQGARVAAHARHGVGEAHGLRVAGAQRVLAGELVRREEALEHEGRRRLEGESGQAAALVREPRHGAMRGHHFATTGVC